MLGLHPRGHRFDSYRDYIIGKKLKWYKLQTVNLKIVGSSPIFPAMEGIIKVEDRNTINNIVFKFPELMREDAEDTIKMKYSHLISLQDKLQEARSNVRSLEEEVKREMEEWRTLQDIVSYSHPTSEKIVKVETCSLTIKGHGNDIIGKTTVM